MVNLLRSSLTSLGNFARDRFLWKTRRASAIQAHFLKQLLREQASTALGRDYKLTHINSIRQFQQQIPILPYDGYEPYVMRAARGEDRVMTQQRPVYFNITSGTTTGRQKFVPITKRHQRTLTRANLAATGFLDGALLRRGKSFGKLLITNGAFISGLTEGGIPYGNGSAGALRLGNSLYSQIFAQPYAALQIKDSPSRHYVCLLFALQIPNLCGIIANFPMLHLRACQYLESWGSDLVASIAAGTIPDYCAIAPELRAELAAQLRPNPTRAAELAGILERDGRLTPIGIWPQLGYVATSRGGTSDFYFERFSPYFGETPVFGALFASAESYFSIYPDFDTDGSILAIESGFYEFIPEDQWEAQTPKTLLGHELTVGARYRVLFTNYSGFYRYDNGDVVEVLGYYHEAPIIVFRFRRGGLISSTSEKTTEAHLTTTMQLLQQEFGSIIDDFCLTLSERDIPAQYILNIELVSGQQLRDGRHLLQRFDKILQEVNPNYATKRADVVPPPRLHVLAPGSFAIVRQRQLAKGMPDSQLKYPHISEDRTLVAGLDVRDVIRLPGDPTVA